MTPSCLWGARFGETNLEGANLVGADMSLMDRTCGGANFKNARYNDATKFPDDFVPEKHQMIFDKDGSYQPIEEIYKEYGIEVVKNPYENIDPQPTNEAKITDRLEIKKEGRLGFFAWLFGLHRKKEWYILPKDKRSTGPYCLKELKEEYSGTSLKVGFKIRKGKKGQWISWVNAIETYPILAYTNIAIPNKKQKLNLKHDNGSKVKHALYSSDETTSQNKESQKRNEVEDEKEEWFLQTKRKKRKGPYTLEELTLVLNGFTAKDGIRIRKGRSAGQWVAWANAIETYPKLAYTNIAISNKDQSKLNVKHATSHRLSDTEISTRELKYFEVPIEVSVFRCSDNQCPCPGTSALVLGKTGYLYVSEEVVDMRKDALTKAALDTKQQRMIDVIDGSVVMFFNQGTVYPIVMCDKAVRRLKLDPSVAAADARHWGATGLVPLRVTPKKR